jgi:undecaprenyl-diphosphatase
VDYSLLHGLNEFFAAHDGLEDAVKAYVGVSELLFAGLIAALLVLPSGPVPVALRRAAVSAAASCGLALLLGQVISHLVDRPRPFVSHPDSVHLFSSHAADPSFPSDHATAAFAIAMAIWLRDRRYGAVALVLAAVLSLGRVALGLHYPMDVVGGAALGIGCAVLLFVVGPVRRRLDGLADAASRLRLRLRLSGS